MTNHSFDNQMSPETYLCHGPFDPEVFGGVVNPPVYHASTVIFKNCKELNERHQALFEDAEDEVMYYGRFGTPITFAVQKALAELEGGYRSLLVPTGLAACTSALLALVKSGDHILVSVSFFTLRVVLYLDDMGDLFLVSVNLRKVTNALSLLI
ncbi:PLP-dependent transferase [Klebsiella pneumoniae]|uniref:PLP-dependent transferase n=1 Tax=Klebsiella pneumoniae TaxID=573 RepID=UPI002AAE4EFB|nr:PLP-dependent transferase [Klebsiella pneumoniae]MDY7355012.1 PLP-dependent transferase [Klebsiella pneumoniae]